MKATLLNTQQYLYISVILILVILQSCGGDPEQNAKSDQQVYYDDYQTEESVDFDDDTDGFTTDKSDIVTSKPYDHKINKSVDLLDLIPGKLAFDIPKKMKVGERYDVIFSITQSLNENILFEGLDSARFEVRNIEVSSAMKVLIYDPDETNFKINSKSSTKPQHVANNRNATWLWHVTPLKKGKHTIIAKVYATLYPQKGGEREVSQIVFNEEINVEATPTFTIANFFNNHWQWLFGTLLIPIFVYLYKKRKVNTSQIN